MQSPPVLFKNLFLATVRELRNRQDGYRGAGGPGPANQAL